ncbi:heme-binding protein [Pedobacter gandavensis]|uniref:heme-binding protein n=1 Tax=Pedobacter gandavensis TaxID=2679963 RepID=UPI00292DF707|nr:heme-binding protein [Pedobacter gandavensis]
MTEQLNKFGMGARFISPAEVAEIDLGPLRPLIGEWETVVLAPGTQNPNSPTPSGWNVMSVPSKSGFEFEVIPYKENLKFSAVAVEAGNRGLVVNGEPVDQMITGLFYEQQIISVCETEACISRGFGNGNVIHAETGLFLYIKNENGGFDIARLGTVPHGNALLALGIGSESTDRGTNFFPEISSVSVKVEGQLPLGYNDVILNYNVFENFSAVNPNIALKDALEEIVGSGTVDKMTTINMSTDQPNSTGGILNIPFLQSNVSASTMDAIFWYEQISGGTETELLQYSQTVNLVFPVPHIDGPIIWPHISVSTMKRMSTLLQQKSEGATFNSADTSSSNTPGVPQL